MEWSYGNIYRHGAPVLQSAMLNSRGLVRKLVRELAGASRFRKKLLATETMTAEELGRWQARKLRGTMEHAYQYVPYYRDRPVMPLGAAGADAMAVLPFWPLLTKEHVIAAGPSLLASDRMMRFQTGTSGSTGTPMTLYRSAGSIGFEQAVIERQLLWAGWRRGDRRVWLRGDMVVPLESRAAPFWRLNLAERMLMCSSFHLSEQTAQQYLSVMERYNPVIIQAYPSSIGLLAKWMVAQGRTYTGTALRGIVTSSEHLSEGCRRDCLKAFGVSVFDWYGQSERVGAIGTCEHGNYHIIEDAGYFELQARADGSSLLVGTAFENPAMPLIRYVTGDCVIPADPGYQCPCGRVFRVIDKVIGRDADTIVTGDGRQHVLMDLIFDDLTTIKLGQIVQETADEVSINVVLNALADLDAVRDTLLTRARERLGPWVRLTFKQVDDIPRTSAGKFRVIVNNVAKNLAG